MHLSCSRVLVPAFTRPKSFICLLESNSFVEIDRKRMKKTRTDVVHNVDALYEIFKHLDAQSLALASCVSTRWHEASIDDNLWEVICTKNWPPTANSIGRLRCVVNVLGGFRHLYVKWLLPLRRHSAASYCKKNAFMEDNTVPWSEDHVRLSMSLLSIEYFEKLASFRTSPC